MKFALVTFLALIGSYYFALETGFLGDDVTRLLLENGSNSLIVALTGELGDRPLLMILMWLQRSLYGLNPLYFRLVNIFIHTLASWQIFKLIQELAPPYATNKIKVATVIAFLFAIHPIHSQTLMIAIQSGITLSGLLGILSLRYFFLFMDTGNQKKLVISSIALGLAILSKPITSFLPVFYFFVWAFMYREKRKNFLFMAPYVLVLLAPVFFYVFLNKNIQTLAISPLSYFLTQTEVLFTYFRLMTFPYGLKYLYDFYPPKDILLNINWLYFFLHLGIIFTALRLLKDKLQRLIFAGFYLSFLPESSFFPIEHLAWEHRTYFPMVFLSLLIANIFIKYEIKFKSLQMVALVLIPTYLMLNQVRNFQIKPVSNWMLHTLENSESHDHFNFSFTTQLLGIEYPGLEPVIDKYRKLYPDSLIYKGLIAAYDYEQDPVFSRLETLASYTKDEIPYSKIRSWLNSFIFDVTRKEGLTSTENLFIEKLLSAQLKIFFAQEHEYKKLIFTYKKIASQLIEDNGKNGFRLENVDTFRIRTNLTQYYHLVFPGLSQEISKELMKNQVDSKLIQ